MRFFRKGVDFLATTGYAYSMNTQSHTFDAPSDDFIRGQQDGYHGYSEDPYGSEDYQAGYISGQDLYCQDANYAESYEAESYDAWNPVEQGMYDDDPNPYHGDF